MSFPTRRTTATQLLQEHVAAGGAISAELNEFILSPQHRLQIYKLLNGRPVRPFAGLIRLLFRREILFRTALWDGTADDRAEDCDGICDCAFLQYRLGDPADVHVLWEAKYLNMDVGTSLGAEFFIGAGLEQTLHYLAKVGGAESAEISHYVREHFESHDAGRWQRDWEERRAEGIDWRTGLSTGAYERVVQSWPDSGRHILASFDDDSVVVYQAYRDSIAQFAVAYQRFGGEFSYSRMSWIKPNFLWMMYRSGWATKEGQERILAVRLRRSFFDSLLARAVPSSFEPDRFESKDAWQDAVADSDVRLQWDPDHDSHGRPLSRRALQIGLRDAALQEYGQSAIVSIEDITVFVRHAHRRVDDARQPLVVPDERVYRPSDFPGPGQG